MPLNAGLTVDNAPEAARKGMRRIRVETLAAGETIFRFASTKRHDGTEVPSERWAASPWWMLEAAYRMINSVYKRGRAVHGDEATSLGLLGRSAMAVQQTWSRADVLIKAHLLDDICVFAGASRTQHREMAPNGVHFTMPGWDGVEQLFIPNVSDRNGRLPLFAQAICVEKQKIVSSQQLY